MVKQRHQDRRLSVEIIRTQKLGQTLKRTQKLAQTLKREIIRTHKN